MEPTDFFKTAELLKNENDECHLRSSISRSYYAIHLYIRQIISQTYLGGRKFPSQPHQNIIKCLQLCTSGDVKEIGEKLKILLQARTDADYHIQKTIKKSKSQDAYEDAIELKQLFDSVLSDPSNKQNLGKSSRQQARFQGILRVIK